MFVECFLGFPLCHENKGIVVFHVAIQPEFAATRLNRGWAGDGTNRLNDFRAIEGRDFQAKGSRKNKRRTYLLQTLNIYLWLKFVARMAFIVQ